jgi:hypothetical protein
LKRRVLNKEQFVAIIKRITPWGVFAEPMYNMLQSDGEISFHSFANIVGVICRGSLNSRLAMLLRMFETNETKADQVDHKQLAQLWNPLSEVFTAMEDEDARLYEQAFNEVVAVAFTLASQWEDLPGKTAAGGGNANVGNDERPAMSPSPPRIASPVGANGAAAVDSTFDTTTTTIVVDEALNTTADNLTLEVNNTSVESAGVAGADLQSSVFESVASEPQNATEISEYSTATTTITEAVNNTTTTTTNNHSSSLQLPPTTPQRARAGSMWSRSSLDRQEANAMAETLTFRVFRAAVLSQPLIVAYFENPLALRL